MATTKNAHQWHSSTIYGPGCSLLNHQSITIFNKVEYLYDMSWAQRKVKPTVTHCKFFLISSQFFIVVIIITKDNIILNQTTSDIVHHNRCHHHKYYPKWPAHHFNRYCTTSTSSPQILSKMTTTPHCSTDIVHIQRDEADSGLLRPPPSCWRHFSGGQIFPSFLDTWLFVEDTFPEVRNFPVSIIPDYLFKIICWRSMIPDYTAWFSG